MSGWRFGLAFCAALLSYSASGWAADPAPVRSGSFVSAPTADWTITLGAEGRLEPAFNGADHNLWRPYPIFDIRRAGTPERFHSPRDGWGVALIDAGPFLAGPVGQLRAPRKQSDDLALLGLGNVDWAIELGAFAEYWMFPWLRARGEARGGVTGHHGFVADLMVDAVVPVTPQLTLSGGPRATFASTAATSPYFSVDAAQSLASGLPVFDAKGGVQSVGLGAQARYRWTPAWTTHVFVEYERLTGDAGNAPLVSQRGDANQVTFGVGVARSFDIKRFW